MGNLTKMYNNIFNSQKVNGAASLGAPDPFIFKWNGYYYLICTRGKGLILMKSFDLLHWENVNKDGNVSNDDSIRSAYAPEMAYYNGYFYIVASPSGDGHYLYRSENITGPYEYYKGNFHELIDGSFFNEEDETKYFLRATESGIVAKIFNDCNEKSDFELFKDNYFYFDDTKIGDWTEGPYLLKRYGKYYLTYTGTHFLSDAYRVDYSSGNKLSREGLKNRGTVLLSTTDEFYGLGHSMTFLGPNLDSYFIAYHNMMPNKNRYLNISRLMFDNYGNMLVSNPKVKNNLLPERPLFEKFISGKDYLSEEEFSNKCCSIEYNFIGENCKLYLAYIDELNNQYATFSDQTLSIYSIINGVSSIVYTKKFLSMDRKNVHHTLRVQYRKGKLAIYFDFIELTHTLKFNLAKGKIGFENNLLDNAYLAYSLNAFGSSDVEATKDTEFYVANCSKYKDEYFTEFKIDDSGEYAIYVSNPSGKVTCRDVRVDKNRFENELVANQINNLVGIVKIKKGSHHFSMKCNGSLNDLKIKIVKYSGENTNLDMDNFIPNCDIYWRYLNVRTGIYLENDRNAIITKEKLFNYTLETKIMLVGNPTAKDRFVGLVADCNNYAKVNQFENAYSLMGYLFVINRNNLYIIDTNFYYSKVLKKVSINTDLEINLKVVKENQELSFYLNNSLIYSINSKYTHGNCGIYNNHASAIFRDIKIFN